MSKKFCLDCGMLLTPRSRICSVCGFDNDKWDNKPVVRPNDQETWVDYGEDVPPENYPGF